MSDELDRAELGGLLYSDAELDETDLAEIERALAAATPGPWYVSESSGDVCCEPDEGGIIVARVETCSRGDADAYLIANAPTWLAALVARVRELDAALSRQVEATEAADMRSHGSRSERVKR